MGAWKEHQIETLKQCVQRGLSAQQASRLIPEFSRSAILGKAFRLNLHFMAHPGGDFETRARKQEMKYLEGLLATTTISQADLMTAGFSESPHVKLAASTKKRKKPTRSGSPDENPFVKGPRELPIPLSPHFDPTAPRRTLETVKRHECRFPIDNAELGEFTYCGLPTMSLKAYCEFHYNRMFRKIITS